MRYFKRHKFFTVVLMLLSIYIYLNYTKVITLNYEMDKTNKFYINDLYLSNGKIYKNYLTKDEQAAYDELI